MNDIERRRKSQRLTGGHGGRTVVYDMKHYPMDDFLRPGYSAKRRANVKQIPKLQSDNDEEMSDDNENEAQRMTSNSSNSLAKRSLESGEVTRLVMHSNNVDHTPLKRDLEMRRNASCSMTMDDEHTFYEKKHAVPLASCSKRCRIFDTGLYFFFWSSRKITSTRSTIGF